MQTATPPQPIVKSIIWDTNYNNKMACNAMLHIDLQPAQMPQPHVVEQVIIEITTADASHPPTLYKLGWMQPMLLNHVPELVTYPSHGMGYVEFYKYLQKKYGPKICGDTQMCIYYYLQHA